MSGAPWLLALHSSSEDLGVGLQPLGQRAAEPRLARFPLGRELSNRLLACVEELLPAPRWPELGRLAVATGPGGFTGTRLTVVLARTLAQQLGVPLDGISSFLLNARRRGLAASGPVWLLQELPRRGVVAGQYGPQPAVPGGVEELMVPRLYRTLEDLPPGRQEPAEVAIPQDVAELLAISQARAAAGCPAPWQAVLPLYPTSPVEGG